MAAGLLRSGSRRRPPRPSPARHPQETLALQCLPASCYFVLLLVYLFLNPEHELLHWLTLAALPIGLVVGLSYRERSPFDFRASIGLRNLRTGWLPVLALAAAFQFVQLLHRDQRVGLASALTLPRGWLLVPRAFLLLVGTAATTEEIFFRGVLQTRLAARAGSELAAVWIGTLAFIAYHVPYAYLVWPSAGHPAAAVEAACANGLLGGCRWR